MATALYSEVLLYRRITVIVLMLLYLPALKVLTFFGNNVRDYTTVNILLVKLHNSSLYVHIHTVRPLLEWLNLTLALL